jgi:hypothetical protein
MISYILSTEERDGLITPKNLGEIMNYAPSVWVTEGAKNESDIKLRG